MENLTKNVDSPDYYKINGKETIDLTLKLANYMKGALGVCVFNILKYLIRFENKHKTLEGKINDLNKILIYAEFLNKDFMFPSVEINCKQSLKKTFLTLAEEMKTHYKNKYIYNNVHIITTYIYLFLLDDIDIKTCIYTIKEHVNNIKANLEYDSI